MIEPDEVVAKIEAALETEEVEIEDLTGTKDHYEVTVVSSEFEGETRVQQHRMVYDALEEELSGPIHALSLETTTPGGG